MTKHCMSSTCLSDKVWFYPQFCVHRCMFSLYWHLVKDTQPGWCTCEDLHGCVDVILETSKAWPSFDVPVRVGIQHCGHQAARISFSMDQIMHCDMISSGVTSYRVAVAVSQLCISIRGTLHCTTTLWLKCSRTWQKLPTFILTANPRR